MGLFKSDRPQRTIRTMRTERPEGSNSDLQYKAKSKLIGAVVLALLGVLILPFIFSNDEPINQPAPTEQAPLVSPSNQTAGGAEGNISISAAPGVLPATPPVAPNANGTTPPAATTTPQATATGTVDAQGNMVAGTAIPQSIANAVGNNPNPMTEVTSSTAPGGQALTITDTTQQAVANTPSTAQESPKPKTEEPKRKTEDKRTAQKSKNTNTIREENRTDDGSVALALLEGKQPPAKSSSSKASTAKSGKYSVQVAAYTSMDDARAQRDKLSASGVSNAFVQSATVNGRQTYRLRVGPFTSQEAAQAALTRLRGLGHGGFITGN